MDGNGRLEAAEGLFSLSDQTAIFQTSIPLLAARADLQLAHSLLVSQNAQLPHLAGVQHGSHSAVAVARQLMTASEQLPRRTETVPRNAAPACAELPRRTVTDVIQRVAASALTEDESRYWTARQAEAALAAERCSRMDSSRNGNVIRNSLGRIPNDLSVHAMPNMAF